MKYLKLWENYNESETEVDLLPNRNDSDLESEIKEIGNRLISKGIIKNDTESPLLRNEGANGITLTFNIDGYDKKLYFFYYKFNNLGLSIVDINNKTKRYYPNDTYGYSYPKISISSISDEDYPKFLVNTNK